MPLLVASALALSPAMPTPNAVVSGSRPSPYGICIPGEHYLALRRHHSVAVWLERPTRSDEFCARHWLQAPQLAALIEWNRELGLELSSARDAEFPAGVPIWFPPEERTPSTCCVWIWSLRDGWVSTQNGSDRLGDVKPSYAHAASDSGSIDVAIYPVPVRHQREWAWLARSRPIQLSDPAVHPEVTKELRDLVNAWNTPNWRPEYHFSFSQWVNERSKVARTIVTLPIAEVDGRLQYAEPPTVHWLDAYGKETSPYEPVSSPIALALASATGGALLGFAAFAVLRRRRDAAG